MTKFYVTRQEVSGCTVEAKNQKEAVALASQLPDNAFEREEECDSLWAEAIEVSGDLTKPFEFMTGVLDLCDAEAEAEEAI